MPYHTELLSIVPGRTPAEATEMAAAGEHFGERARHELHAL